MTRKTARQDELQNAQPVPDTPEQAEPDPDQPDQPVEDPGTQEDTPEEGDQEATTGAAAGRARDPEDVEEGPDDDGSQ